MEPQAEAYYQRLFEDAPIGIYRSTPDGKFSDANKALIKMLGFEDLPSLMDAYFPDLFADPRKKLEQQAPVKCDDKVSSFEVHLKRSDGTDICVRNTMHVIRDDNGKVRFFEGVLEDVTERVQSKAALLDSRSRVEAEQAQRQLAETLQEITNLISGSLEFEKVTQRIFINLKRLLPFDSASLILQQDDQFTIAASSGFPHPEKLRKLRIDINKDPLTKEVLETKQPLLLENATHDARFQNYGSSLAIKSWLAVPLITRDQAIGILTLDSASSGVYREREIQVALTLASQIASAIENARLYEGERQRANIMSALRATLTDITAELDLETLLNAILERATNLLNATGGELGLYDAPKNIITIVACHNMIRDFTGSKMLPGHGAIGKVVLSGKPLIIDDYRIWDGHLSSAVIWPWKGVIAVPLIARERILGVIVLADSNPERSFDQSDLLTLSLFAQQAAIAIENAQLFDLITSALSNSQTLYQTAQALIKTENLNDLFRNLVEKVAQTLPADRVILITIDSIRQKITNYIMGGPRSERLVPVSYEELMDGLTGWVMRERQSALSLKASPDDREQPYVREKRLQSDSGSLMVVPLIYRQQILGTLTAISNPEAREYTQTDVGLLETIASHAAAAIKNAQLFEEIQQLAETDDLTGINNRRQLFNLGERELLRSKRYKDPLSVIMLDIDNFKKINDTFGHAIGDVVLRSLARFCQKNIREIDILGRYGGEEFVIVLPNTSEDQGYEAAERLRLQVENAQISTKVGALKITISLGVAEMNANTPNLATLIDRADTALYRAKNSGKNRVEAGK